MKYSIYSLLLALVVFSCGGPEGEKVESGEAIDEQTTTQATATYVVDAAQSTINWEGTKLVGGGHQGDIAIKSGRVAVNDGKIVGGEFIIDMASINNTDLDENSGKGKLEGHLKAPDFFDVEKYPTAKFTLLNAQPTPGGDGAAYTVTGNLTMKDSTRSVSIPMMISMEGGQLKAKSEQFVIDRTEWGVEYGSGSIDGIAKDNIINDNIGLSMTVVAKEQ